MEYQYSSSEALTVVNQTEDLGLSVKYHPAVAVLVVSMLSLLTLCCVVGNFFVIVLIIVIDQLRDRVCNILIVSLAVSDLLVGVGVMPLAILYEVTGRWILGRVACAAWVTVDVTLCTASILNLTVIAIEKYSNISTDMLPQSRSRLTAIYCGLVWSVSLTIGITPIVVGWEPVQENGVCIVNQNIGYQLYATIGAFYVPIFIMIVLYVKIYLITSRIVKADAKLCPVPLEAMDNLHVNELEEGSQSITAESDLSMLSNNKNMDNGQQNQKSSSTKNTRKRNVHSTKKMVRTLGILMGMFTVCWLPFFIYAVVRACCKEGCDIPQPVVSFLTWLGYLNSCLNPLIYARFHQSFRTPMKEMLFCRCWNIKQSMRRQMYVHAYG